MLHWPFPREITIGIPNRLALALTPHEPTPADRPSTWTVVVPDDGLLVIVVLPAILVVAVVVLPRLRGERFPLALVLVLMLMIVIVVAVIVPV